MCRLFGFRSVIPSPVHRSLLHAENALGLQSNQHPDGWGVAHYVDGSPHITKSPTRALGDQLFHRVSAVVASETVLAHVRKATQGDNGLLNCHPFQYGRWVFAHNGDLPEFAEKIRGELTQAVSPRLQRFILGDTDSELIFLLVLTEIEKKRPLASKSTLEEAMSALGRALEIVQELCARVQAKGPVLTTCILTDGDLMMGAQGGKELLYSTYKTRCPDRESCPSLSLSCEAPSSSGPVNHLVFSSESLQGDNVWSPLCSGEILGTDASMRLLRKEVGRRDLPLAAG